MNRLEEIETIEAHNKSLLFYLANHSHLDQAADYIYISSDV